MPIYEYRCRTCGEKFDIYCSARDSDKKEKCTKCGGSDTEKTFSSFGTTSSTIRPTCAPRRFG